MISALTRTLYFVLASVCTTPFSLKNIFKNTIALWKKWAMNLYDEAAKKHLLKQNNVIIDLRRGKTEWYNTNDNKMTGICGTDILDGEHRPTYCPIKKEFLCNVESIILAIPGHSKSAYYHELISTINPDKVVELVVFEPNDLSIIFAYKYVKKISLINVKNLVDFDQLKIFCCLNEVFISYNKEDDSNENPFCDIDRLRVLSQKFHLKIVLIHKSNFEVFYNSSDLCTCPDFLPKPLDTGAKNGRQIDE